MDFTFYNGENKLLATQKNGVPFVLENLGKTDEEGYILRYPGRSNRFEAIFRAHNMTRPRSQPDTPSPMVDLDAL